MLRLAAEGATGMRRQTKFGTKSSWARGLHWRTPNAARASTTSAGAVAGWQKNPGVPKWPLRLANLKWQKKKKTHLLLRTLESSALFLWLCIRGRELRLWRLPQHCLNLTIILKLKKFNRNNLQICFLRYYFIFLKNTLHLHQILNFCITLGDEQGPGFLPVPKTFGLE